MTLLEVLQYNQNIIWNNTEVLYSNQEKIIEVLVYINVMIGLMFIIQIIFLYEHYRKASP